MSEADAEDGTPLVVDDQYVKMSEAQ